jgi:hypothetical protein
MAYDISNPPSLIAQGISRGANKDIRLWHYSSADTLAEVVDEGYFTNGYALGIRTGDLVRVSDNDGITSTDLLVTAATPDGITVVDNSSSKNEKIITDWTQMPEPTLVDGVLTIDPGNNQYYLNNDVFSPYPLTTPGEGNVWTWKTNNRAKWIYTGDVACFWGKNASGFIEFRGAMEFQSPHAPMFDIDEGGNGKRWSIQAFGLPRFTNCSSLGTLKGPGGFNTFFGSYTDFQDGFVLEDLDFHEHNLMFVLAPPNQVLNYDAQTTAFTLGEVVTDDGPGSASGVVQFDRNDGTSGKLTLSSVSGTFTDDAVLTGSLSGVAAVNGVLENMVIFTVQGANTSGPVTFSGLDWFSDENQTLWDIKKEIETTVDTISLLANRSQITENPPAFASGSLDQTAPKVKASDNNFLPDSTVKAKLSFEDNTLTTTLNTIDVAEPINAIWSDGTLEERLCFQDWCTFDNTTNTITAVNDIDLITPILTHGLSNGDIVTMVEDGGLPAELVDKKEYFVVNVTATTFQLSLTLGGSVVEFTDDGTPDNYYCHDTGLSSSGWVIYTGIQDVSIIVQGWIGLDKSGSAQNASAQLFKTDVNFVETAAARGSKTTVSNTAGQSSTISDLIDLSRYEGIKIKLDPRTAVPDDMDVTDADITFSKS